MEFFHSESVKELTPLVQKIIHNRDSKKELFEPEALTGVKRILNIWKDEKEHFRVDLFKDHLVAEFGEVSIHLEAEQKKALIREFIKKIDEDWTTMFPEYEDYLDEVSDFCSFLDANEEQLFSNKNEVDWEAPDGTIINAGTKISKSFKHFFEDPGLVRQLQDKFSLLIQQDKMTGILCASIHPLDYLSSSENNYKWRSCHALNGDYASGNLSYMMDNCTIIFYLKGADNVKLPRFPEDVPWNDKKWRMLVFLHPENKIVWAGRQYPFFSQDLLDKSLDMINQMIGYTFSQWQHEYIDRFMMPVSFEERSLNDLYIYRYGTMFTRNQLIKDACYSAHYDDLLYSSTYVPYYSFNIYESVDPNSLPKITIGHSRKCARCGDFRNIGAEDFICGNCYDVIDPPRCECCNAVCSADVLQWYSGLGSICPECEEKYTVKCPTCNHRHSKNRKCSFCIGPFASKIEQSFLNAIEESENTQSSLNELREMYDHLETLIDEQMISTDPNFNQFVDVRNIGLDNPATAGIIYRPPPEEALYTIKGVDLTNV